MDNMSEHNSDLENSVKSPEEETAAVTGETEDGISKALIGAIPDEKTASTKGGTAGKKLRRLVPLIVVAVVLVIALIGCLTVYKYMNRPAAKAGEALATGDIDAAGEYFLNVDDGKEATKLRTDALAYAGQLRDEYIAEAAGAEYVTTLSQLNKLENGILAGDEELANIVAQVDRINNSRIAYSTAEKFSVAGRFAEAIEEYGNVIEEDTAYYALAQDAVLENMSLCRQNALDTATALEDAGDYKGARQTLQEVLEVLENDASLTSELKVVDAYITKTEQEAEQKKEEEAQQAQDAEVEQIVADLDAAISVTDSDEAYATAFDKLSKALSKYPDNAELLSKQEAIESKCKEDYYARLNVLHEAYDIDSALELLDTLKKLLPGDGEIDDLITEYEGYKPVSLWSLEIYEDNGYDGCYEISGTYSDTYGNEYTDATCIKVYRDKSKNYGDLVYLLNGAYNHIRGTMAFMKSDDRDYTKGSVGIRFYADGTQIYASKYVDDSTKAFDFEVEIPEDCHKLELTWVTGNGNYYGKAILSGVELYNR